MGQIKVALVAVVEAQLEGICERYSKDEEMFRSQLAVSDATELSYDGFQNQITWELLLYPRFTSALLCVVAHTAFLDQIKP